MCAIVQLLRKFGPTDAARTTLVIFSPSLGNKQPTALRNKGGPWQARYRITSWARTVSPFRHSPVQIIRTTNYWQALLSPLEKKRQALLSKKKS